MYSLQVHQPDLDPFQLVLGDSPILVGRAPSNDLVVSDEQVSWHHAAVWVEGGRVWVRDMGSKNGTFRNGNRVRGAAEVGAEDVVRLGAHLEIRVRSDEEPLPVVARSFLLEDLVSGVRCPIRSDRFHIGSAADADFQIEDAGPRVATLILHDTGEIALGTDDSETPLKPGQSFEVAGRQLRITEVSPTQSPTLEPDPDRYPYRLEVTLDGPTGARARLEDPDAELEYVVDAENRVILLYLLARQIETDRSAKKPVAEQGWCSDDEVSVGVWGRGGAGDANSLHVLVYRLRKELKKAGFDPWFIEKKRRAVRVRLRSVSVG